MLACVCLWQSLHVLNEYVVHECLMNEMDNNFLSIMTIAYRVFTFRDSLYISNAYAVAAFIQMLTKYVGLG